MNLKGLSEVNVFACEAIKNHETGFTDSEVLLKLYCCGCKGTNLAVFRIFMNLLFWRGLDFV